MANSHQTDHEDLKQGKDLGVVHELEQGPLPCSLWKTAWLGLCLNAMSSGCADVCNPKACSTMGTPLSGGCCQSHGNHSPWEPRAEPLTAQGQRILLSAVIRVAFAVYCWLENPSFIMAESDITSLHSDYPKNLTGKRGRNLDRPVASYQPGNVLTWQVIIHELS